MDQMAGGHSDRGLFYTYMWWRKMEAGETRPCLSREEHHMIVSTVYHMTRTAKRFYTRIAVLTEA
jgi:hypothetical protein